jgi:hypothetical protein
MIVLKLLLSISFRIPHTGEFSSDGNIILSPVYNKIMKILGHKAPPYLFKIVWPVFIGIIVFTITDHL